MNVGDCFQTPLPEPSISAGYWSHLCCPVFFGLYSKRYTNLSFQPASSLLGVNCCSSTINSWQAMSVMGFHCRVSGLNTNPDLPQWPFWRPEASPWHSLPDMYCDSGAAKGLHMGAKVLTSWVPNQQLLPASNLNPALTWFRYQEATSFRTQTPLPAPGCES